MRRTATVLAALAGFVPLPLPPGGDAGIIDFAASGNNWAARTDDPNSLQLTTDAGGSWRTIRLGASPGAGMSVGPDGGFWIPANQGPQRVLVHVSTDGAVTTQPVAASGGLMSPPAWDPAGHMWVALAAEGPGRDGTVMTLDRLNPDGSVAEQMQGSSKGSEDFPFVVFMGGTAYAGAHNSIFRAERGGLVLLSGSAADPPHFLQTDLWPEQLVGSTLVGFHAISADGGKTFAYTDRAQFGVHGDPDLLMRFPVDQQPSPVLMQRCGGFVFCDTDVAAPSGVGGLWRTPAGIVAVPVDSTAPTPLAPGLMKPVFQIDRDPIAKQDASIGKIDAQSRRIMARLNFHRRRAGLPPLIVDARMNAAARAHARYLFKHVPRGKLDLGNAHVEKRGQSGFTGVTGPERCLAQGGVLCTGEEVISGRRPSDTIVSLYYHRLAVMSPFTQYGGAATVGPYTVYVIDTHREAIAIRPSGYPSGHYDGPLTLQGRELPDPWELCRPPPLRTGSYHGVPITFEPPAREPSRPANLRIEIRNGPDVTVFGTKLYIGRKAVPGCNNNGTFMPKPALRPHTTYTAKTVWQPSPEQGKQTYTWHFRTR